MKGIKINNMHFREESPFYIIKINQAKVSAEPLFTLDTQTSFAYVSLAGTGISYPLTSEKEKKEGMK